MLSFRQLKHESRKEKLAHLAVSSDQSAHEASFQGSNAVIAGTRVPDAEPHEAKRDASACARRAAIASLRQQSRSALMQDLLDAHRLVHFGRDSGKGNEATCGQSRQLSPPFGGNLQQLSKLGLQVMNWGGVFSFVKPLSMGRGKFL